MNIFGKKKAKIMSDGGEDCCKMQTMQPGKNIPRTNPKVEILGSGCEKCNQLEAATKEALEQLGMDTFIEHITDFTRIAAYGVMTTPALVLDGKVVACGRVLKSKEIAEILQKTRG